MRRFCAHGSCGPPSGTAEGLKANLRRAYNLFNEEILESCAKQAEFRSIIFALCYFHAALLERKKFGECVRVFACACPVVRVLTSCTRRCLCSPGFAFLPPPLRLSVSLLCP